MTQARYKYVEIECNVCGGSDLHFKGFRRNAHNDHAVKIVECRNCGLIFPNPMPTVENIDELYGDIDYFFQHPMGEKLANYERLIRHLEAILGRKGALLDIASGRGELLRKAEELEWRCTGIDISKTFCDYVKEQYGINVIHGDFLTTTLQGSFDVIVANGVLEHVYDPRTFVQKSYDLLEPGGLLYLDLPNEASLYTKLGNIYYKLRMSKYCINLAPTFPPFHVYGFTRKSLKYLANEIGFTIVDIRTIGRGYMPGAKWNSLEKMAVKAIDSLSGKLDMKPHFAVVLRK